MATAVTTSGPISTASRATGRPRPSAHDSPKQDCPPTIVSRPCSIDTGRDMRGNLGADQVAPALADRDDGIGRRHSEAGQNLVQDLRQSAGAQDPLSSRSGSGFHGTGRS